ncbi:MAG: EAL domain-containing protein [Motiliproteus sp.]
MTNRSTARKVKRIHLPTLTTLLVWRMALLALLTAVLIGYAIQQKNQVVQLSEVQLTELQAKLIETRQILRQHLDWQVLASQLSNHVIEFQLEFELLTLDPDRSDQQARHLQQRFDAFYRQLTANSNDNDNRLPSSLVESIKADVWILNDIAEELLETPSSSVRLQLYRDTIEPVMRIRQTFRAINRDLDKRNLILEQHVDAIVSDSSARAIHLAQLFNSRGNQLIMVLLFAIGSAFFIFRSFLGQFHTRIKLLENYAESIGSEKFSSPPFSSKDITGRLAVRLGLTSRKIRDSLKQAHESRQQTEKLAYFDPLTGLENRRLFYLNLEQGIASVKRYQEQRTLIYMDLDNFKQINDTIGHDAGDQLLINVAQRLRSAMRQEDTISRLGGDEFAIIARHDREASAALAGRILLLLSEPMSLGEHRVRPSASIGITVIGEDGDSTSELMKNADLALYHAKDEGRNNYQFFSTKLQTQSQIKLILVGDMRRALENGEFFLVYQPQYDVQSQNMVGLEALLRWNHPERGLVNPAEFIPTAEESGLIIPIGEWVIRQACQDISALGLAQYDLSVAVNLSAKQFDDPQLIEKILAICDKQRITPGQLEIEVTESMLLSNIDRSIRLLKQLQDRGIHIAIDDFGTGFSSMSYLKNLPVNLLKIDRSFVMGLPDNDKDAAIVESVISLAHRLGLHVVAEGVETEAQLAFLRSHHCDLVQGFLLAKPQPLDALFGQFTESLVHH